jgi:ubiquinone/menaquinone biosynthesis C-methylase UbiE
LKGITDTTEKQYDDMYAGNYMDSDDYSIWARDELRTRQLHDMLTYIPHRPKKLLDYGCGVGGWLPFLRRIFPDAEIHGMDISGIALKKAKEKFPDCSFHHLKDSIASLKDDSFDLLFSYHVLEHVDDIKASVKDIARLISKDGYLFITFPCGNSGSLIGSAMDLLEGGKQASRTGEDIFFFEIDSGHVRRLTSEETINGIAKLSEFEQKLGNIRIHNSLIVQHSGCWPEGENQPNLTYVDNTEESHKCQHMCPTQ